jgi:hypothetical protein
MFAKLTLPPGCMIESASDTEIIIRIPNAQLGETAILHLATVKGVPDAYAPGYDTQEVYTDDATLALDSGLIEAHWKSGRIQWGRDAIFRGRTCFSLPTYDFTPWDDDDREKHEPPLNGYTDVAVQLRNGVIETGRVQNFSWGRHFSPNEGVDIVGFAFLPKER